MSLKLTYIDESDRCFGLSGMAISMALLDDGNKIADIDIDRIDNPIAFSHEFFFSGNPRCSAKIVWDEMAHNFNLSVAMALGNVLSRKLVSEKDFFHEEEEKALHDLAVTEGLEICGLEADEVEMLWEKDFNYLTRVFRHPTVIQLTRDMAEEIRRRRTLSRHEINEILSALNGW